MEITKLEIQNFKNLKNATYNLSKVNSIVGKNHVGKTNSIQSVSWLLSDKLIDNTSNDQSLKPIDNSKDKVSVKITFKADDDTIHSIEKSYKEKWTKTRGSDEMTLTGHDTIYKIDDIIQDKISVAKKGINTLLGINPDDYIAIKDFNIYQALTNPLYLPEMLDWKSLRALIISIIGEVTAEEIFKENDATKQATELLQKYSYDVDKVVKYCSQEINGIKESIDNFNSQIELLQSSQDVPSEELLEITSKIEKLQCENIELRDSKVDNPMLEQALKERETLKKKILEKELEENSIFNQKLIEFNNISQKLSDEKNTKFKAKCNVENELSLAENDISINARLIESKEKLFNDLMLKKDDLIAVYRTLKSMNYQNTLELIKCPNCGEIINAEEVENHKQAWQKRQDELIQNNIRDGKETALQIQETQKEIQSLKVIRVELEENKKSIEFKLQNAIEELNQASSNLSNHKELNSPQNTESEVLRIMKIDLQRLDRDIKELSNEDNINLPFREEKIRQNNDEIQQLKMRESVHYIYLKNQEELEEKRARVKFLSREKIKFEVIKESAVLFNKTKLSILEKKLTAHFGEEIKFILLENNIKEGSWNTTCYPLIVGKNTPFKSGSTSEKIITGIKIIEVFKKELKLPNLPILIDEIGELDSESISKLLAITNSQIIATKVDDNYLIPTLKN